jgi:hypothetical protein
MQATPSAVAMHPVSQGFNREMPILGWTGQNPRV